MRVSNKRVALFGLVLLSAFAGVVVLTRLAQQTSTHASGPVGVSLQECRVKAETELPQDGTAAQPEEKERDEAWLELVPYPARDEDQYSHQHSGRTSPADDGT